MNDICDHCGKPIKRAVHLNYQGHDLKYGPKCAKEVKRLIASGMKPIMYGKDRERVNHANA